MHVRYAVELTSKERDELEALHSELRRLRRRRGAFLARSIDFRECEMDDFAHSPRGAAAESELCRQARN